MLTLMHVSIYLSLSLSSRTYSSLSFVQNSIAVVNLFRTVEEALHEVNPPICIASFSTIENLDRRIDVLLAFGE